MIRQLANLFFVPVFAVMSCGLGHAAESNRLFTVSHPDLRSAGGSGDSITPLISLHGRYVAFASTARNLTPKPLPAPRVAVLDVFVHDRLAAETLLVSERYDGGGGDSDSVPTAITPYGQHVLYEGAAAGLVIADTNGVADVFLRDLVGRTNLLVSANTNGWSGNGPSDSSTMTPDGRYVAFVSAASDLVPADTNGIPDIFVRDMLSGTTLLASAGALSTRPTTRAGACARPIITPDGRFVAFLSTATNLVPGVTNTSQLYVHDTLERTTEWVSRDAGTYLTTQFGTNFGLCWNHAISDDGRFIAYVATARARTNQYPGLLLSYDRSSALTTVVHTNVSVPPEPYASAGTLDMTPDGAFVTFLANDGGVDGSTTCVMRWERSTGELRVVSLDLNGQVPANSACNWPSMDRSGRYIVFVSDATNLVSGTLPPGLNMYRRDLGTDAIELLNTSVAGTVPLQWTAIPSMTDDASRVAFECHDGVLVAGDNNRCTDVFVRDVSSETTRMISARNPELVPLAANGVSWITPWCSSSNGATITFTTDASDLEPGDTNGLRDVYVRHMHSGANRIVSVSSDGIPGNGTSYGAAISRDGNYVAFTSLATNLVAGDVNGVEDVFVRDLRLGTTVLVSANLAGGSGNGPSGSAQFSPDGRYVLFSSTARDLAAGTFSGKNLFWRDIQGANTVALSTVGLSNPAAQISADGHRVVFVEGSSLVLWDSLRSQRIRTIQHPGAAIVHAGISPDGERVVYSISGSVYAVTLKTGELRQIGPAKEIDPERWVCFSADSDTLSYRSVTSYWSQVYLYSFPNRKLTLVSHAFSDSARGGFGHSRRPDISPDGRYVVFCSDATDLLPETKARQPGTYLFDSITGNNTLLVASRSGSGMPNRPLLSPLFSYDGDSILFTTWATDLVEGDYYAHSSKILSFAFLRGRITSSDSGPLVSLPFVEGNSYRLEFKDRLEDVTWQTVSGTATNDGVKAYLVDPNPHPAQRFYRVNAQ